MVLDSIFDRYSCTKITILLNLISVVYHIILSIGRPSSRYAVPPFGGDDLYLRPPFGIKWNTRHIYRSTTHAGGPTHFRDEFEHLSDVNVNWTPYHEYEELMPQVYYDHYGG